MQRRPASSLPGRLASWLRPGGRWPREVRDTLFSLLLIAWIILPQLAHLPLWCSALIVLVLVWRGTLALRSRPLPRRRWLVLLLAIAVAGTLGTYRTLAGPEAGVTLLVTLLALKTLELRARRDALVIFFLGFFTLLTSFLQSQSLLAAAWMFVALLGLLTALVNAQRPVGTPLLRESAATAIRLTAAGLPLMIALFLFFPRLPPLWSMPTDDSVGRSGLSGQMQVGQVARLALDDSVALRVRFAADPPAQRNLYFRGPVLEAFDGHSWQARTARAAARAPVTDLQVHGAPTDYTVTLQPSDQPWLLTLDATPDAPALPPHWQARQTHALQWLANRPVTQLLRYEVRSYVDFEYGKQVRPGADGWAAARNLALPSGFNPRTLALARQLREQAGASDRAVVQAALQRLRSGGYQYTLAPGLTGRDAADEFWFDTRRGFCEHIASAFAILMRGAGIPARIVTGFQGGERNPFDDHWVIRNSDAHAWNEVWLPGQGWTRVDPTGAVTPGRIDEVERLRAPAGFTATALRALSPDLLLRLRLTWDAVNNRWNQWVLAYSDHQQFNLLKKLGFDAPNWQDLLKVLAGLVAGAALLVALASSLRRRRRDPWLQLLQAARGRLQRAGVVAGRQAAPGELAARVAASRLPAADRAAWQRWLRALERWRYAPADAPGRHSLATLRRALKKISP
ncbi:MAG: DUF3488 and transglutaminase-like domain-containing protein [Ottowia sp.]